MLKRIWRGLCWSEKYGDHPGTMPLIAYCLIGAVSAGWVGFLGMLLIFGPLYIYGAYERGA